MKQNDKEYSKLLQEDYDRISEKLVEISKFISEKRDEIKDKYGLEIEITLQNGCGKVSIANESYNISWG